MLEVTTRLVVCPAALPAGLAATAPARYAFTEANGFEVAPYGCFKIDEDLTFSARETRLGFNVKVPDTPNLKVTGRLETDFYGDLSLATARTLNQRTFATLFYKVTPSFMIGGEYSVLKTGFKGEEDVTDNRVQFSGQLTY